MTAKDAISPQIVPLRSATTYREGLEEMRNAGRHILPVVDDGVYIGLVSDSAPLYAMESVGDAVTVMKPVIASTPMPLLLWRMVDEQASIFPVVDDLTGDYIGAVDRESIIRSVARLFPQVDESTELTITCRPSQYSASAIAHAVEDADAHLLNLNVTAGTAPDCPQQCGCVSTTVAESRWHARCSVTDMTRLKWRHAGTCKFGSCREGERLVALSGGVT